MTQTGQLLATCCELKPAVDVTGIATGLLALGTLCLAVSTRSAAQAARRAAQAAQVAAGVAMQQLKYAQRPVVAPVITADRPTSGPAGNPERSRLAIPLQNLGVGPALDVVIAVRPIPAARSRESLQQPAIAVGAQVVVYLETFGAPTAPRFALDVRYRDLSGRRYGTTARWNPVEHRYDDVILTDPS